MNPEVYNFISLDLPALLTATFCALSCALLGNFLILRRIGLMGDAISHAVLPGIVVAFLLTGSRATLPVFLGAAVAGILAAVLVELVRTLGRLESGASMGVVFSIMFAAGVLMMEQAAARSVDLDADCLLHGQLERIIWFPVNSWSGLLTLGTLQALPRELVTSAAVLLTIFFFITIFFKELLLSTFDSALSSALGFNATLLHYIIMVFVALAVVASFEAVGSILVISMLICPAATARLFTDRLKNQLVLSALIAAVGAWVGYIFAAFGPIWLGYSNSVNSAGMISVVSGVFLGFAILFAPRYGVVARKLRDIWLSLRVAGDDILGDLYRQEERIGSGSKDERSLSVSGLRQILASVILKCKGEIEGPSDCPKLTQRGRELAVSLISSHRMWESFLVEKAGLRPDHVHLSAEKLEHFTSDEMTDVLEEITTDTDPHGSPIPHKKSK